MYMSEPNTENLISELDLTDLEKEDTTQDNNISDALEMIDEIFAKAEKTNENLIEKHSKTGHKNSIDNCNCPIAKKYRDSEKRDTTSKKYVSSNNPVGRPKNEIVHIFKRFRDNTKGIDPNVYFCLCGCGKKYNKADMIGKKINCHICKDEFVFSDLKFPLKPICDSCNWREPWNKKGVPLVESKVIKEAIDKVKEVKEKENMNSDDLDILLKNIGLT